MSLRPDDRSSRNRDRSSTRRDRSRSNVRAAPPEDDRSQVTAYRESQYEVRAPESRSAPYPSDDFQLSKYDSRRDDYTRQDDRRQDYRRKDDSDSDRSALAYRDSDRSTPAYRDNDRSGQPSYQEFRPEPRDRASSYTKPSDKIIYEEDRYKREDRYEERRDDRRDERYEVRRGDPRDNRRDDRYEERGNSRLIEMRPDNDIRTSSNSLVPGLTPGMHRLSVSGGRPEAGGRPPASPLLEAYHGTYQSISPMPMAMRLDDDDIPSLDYVQPKSKKKVKLYDPEADAKALAKALNSSSPNAEVICDILPPLTDDQVWELRKEYKKSYKVGGKGVNLSKHLKMKLTGNFGKIVYVTALGRWESEGYWANFFYQSHASRRELLIESLMGRSNADIRSIKEDFKDKRYNDDLVRCMEKELKMDKFRTAVLMALEARRQEEQDIYPHEYTAKDVEVLQRSVRAQQGGESAMLEIVVRRSDAHLRECLRLHESMYGENFARLALKKSNNLVGEVIAHILNGVINKPARDAILLRHAIKDIANHNKDDELRYELLTSRLVRLHWDRMHMMRVKKEYKDKYGKYLEEDLEDSTKGDFRDFVCELCRVQSAK